MAIIIQKFIIILHRLLPQSLPSNVANSELKDDFDMSTMHIVMVDKDMDAKEKKAMMSEIDDVKGVKWTLGL